VDKVAQLLRGPFTRAMAREAGLSDRMLQGKRFVRVLPRVWRHVDLVMTDDDWRVAAALALPPTAHLTGISRLQAAGLDYGPRLPVRYVVQGELHLAFDNVFLHRTKLLPPLDHVGSRSRRRSSPTAPPLGSSTASRSETGCFIASCSISMR
jgi:hypothetical protein